LFPAESHIYGCFKGDELQGGLAGFMENGKFYSGGYPVTQFQGIVFKQGMEDKYSIVEHLRDAVNGTVINHYSVTDIRPFLWKGWTPIVRYSYLLEPSESKLTKEASYEIRHDANNVKDGNLYEFYDMYVKTFIRKGLPVPVELGFMERLAATYHMTIKMSEDAGAMVIQYKDTGYYIFGASSGSGCSTKTVWEAIKDFKMVDMCGANSRDIALYKRGFGATLTPYMGAANV
jgi:hypothetical protein